MTSPLRSRLSGRIRVAVLRRVTAALPGRPRAAGGRSW
ncbi:hypothetical protein SUDANB95_07409 [Actinosynnema sp. ALI-1.44]